MTEEEYDEAEAKGFDYLWGATWYEDYGQYEEEVDEARD